MNNTLGEEGKVKLIKIIESRMNNVSESTDRLYEQTNKLVQIKKDYPKIENTSKFIIIEKLFNFRLIISLILLDLCVAVLIHLRGKFNYEGIYSLRQIIVIINEGYKKLYHFVNNDQNTKNRRNSFWIKEIGFIVKNELKELETSYGLITKNLDDFIIEVESLFGIRNFSVHYDAYAIKVYEMMKQLNQPSTFSTLIQFLKILNDMHDFSSKIQTELLKNHYQISKEGDHVIFNILDRTNPGKITDELAQIINFAKAVSSRRKSSQ